MAEQSDRIENQLKELSADLRGFGKEVHDALMTQAANINLMVTSQKELVSAFYNEKDNDRRHIKGPNTVSIALVLTVIGLLASNFYLVIQGVDRKASGIEARASGKIKEVDQRLALHWSQPMHSSALKEFGSLTARLSTIEEREKNNQRALEARVAGMQKQIDTLEQNQRDTRHWMYGQKPSWKE